VLVLVAAATVVLIGPILASLLRSRPVRATAVLVGISTLALVLLASVPAPVAGVPEHLLVRVALASASVLVPEPSVVVAPLLDGVSLRVVTVGATPPAVLVAGAVTVVC